MKSSHISKRAASPLTKFKTRDNIEELFVEYNDDATLFSRRADSHYWATRSAQLSYQADILNANASLTRQSTGEMRYYLLEIDAQLRSILEREDEFLDPDYIDECGIIMHYNFDRADIFSNGDNLSNLELCSAAFDQIALFVQDGAIADMLYKIKNAILYYAARKTSVQHAQQRANAILDYQLAQEQRTTKYLENEIRALRNDLESEKARLQRMQRDYEVIYRLELKYEADASLQEQTNIQLTRINAEITRDNAKKAQQRDEYMERTRRLTRVIYKLKDQQDTTVRILQRTDEQLKGCKNERDELLLQLAAREADVNRLRTAAEKTNSQMQAAQKEHEYETQKLLERIEMGAVVDGIKMENADDDYLLSQCIKDGIASLVALSDENKQDYLHYVFGVDRHQLFNLKYVLTHLRDMDTRDEVTHFFANDFLDLYVQQQSRAVQVTTGTQNQRIVYRYVGAGDGEQPTTSRGEITGRRMMGSLANRSLEANQDAVAFEHRKTAALAKLGSSRVTVTYNTADALPGYYGTMKQEVLRRKSSVISLETQLEGSKYERSVSEAIDAPSVPFAPFVPPPYPAQQISNQTADLYLQLRHLHRNITSTIGIIGQSSSEEVDLAGRVETVLGRDVSESESQYAYLARQIHGQVQNIVSDVFTTPRAQYDAVVDYLQKKSYQLSAILNIPLALLQNALDEVAGGKNTEIPRHDEPAAYPLLHQLSSVQDQFRLPRGRSSAQSLSFSMSETTLELSELAEIAEGMQSPLTKADKNVYTTVIAQDIDLQQSGSQIKIAHKKSVLDQLDSRVMKSTFSKESPQLGASKREERQDAEMQPPVPRQQRSNLKFNFSDEKLIDARICDDFDSGRQNPAAKDEQQPGRSQSAFEQQNSQMQIGLRANNSDDFLVADVKTSGRQHVEDALNQKQRKITAKSQMSRKTSARPMSALSNVISKLRYNATESGPTESTNCNASYSTLRIESTVNISGSVHGKTHTDNNSSADNANADNASDGMMCAVDTEPSKRADTCQSPPYGEQTFQLDCFATALQEMTPETLEYVQMHVRYAVTTQDHAVQAENTVSKERIFDVMFRSSYQQTELAQTRDFYMQTDRTVENSISDQVIFKDMMSMIESSVNQPRIDIYAYLEQTPIFLSTYMRNDAQRQEMMQYCAPQTSADDKESTASRLERRLKKAANESSAAIYASGVQLKSQQGVRNYQIVSNAKLVAQKAVPGVLPGIKEQKPSAPDIFSGLDESIVITQPLFMRTEPASVKKHPYAGEFPGYGMRSLLEPPVAEQFMLQYATDRVYYRFMPLQANIENAFFAPSVVLALPDTQLQKVALHNATRTHFQAEIRRVTGVSPDPARVQEGKDRSMLPRIGERVGYVRLSACVLSYAGQFPRAPEFASGSRVFIRECEYVCVPVQHAILKPLSWVKALFAAMLRDRLACSIAQVCEMQDDAQSVRPIQLEQARFSVLPGQLDALQALSFSEFAVYWARQRYGARALVQAALWNLVVNAVYWQHEDNDIYVLCRLFFNDAPQDFYELYLDIMRRAGFESSDNASNQGQHTDGQSNAIPATVRVDAHKQQRKRATISLQQIPAFVKAVVPAFSDKRVDAFYSSVIALQYQHATSVAATTAVDQNVDFSTFVSMLLFAYASYRKSAFQAMVQILKFFGRDLGQSAFREFLGLVRAGLNSFTISEIFHVYYQEGILRFEDVGKLFCEFQLARFCQIEAKTLQEVVSNDIQRMTNSCAIVYQRMQANARKIYRYMARSQQQRLKASFEVLYTDILVYDVTSCINGFQVVIQLIIQSLGEKAPDACLAVIAGTVSSLNQVISDV